MLAEVKSEITTIDNIDKVLSAQLSERLNGEFTFSFSVIADKNAVILPNMTVKLSGLWHKNIPLIVIEVGGATYTKPIVMFVEKDGSVHKIPPRMLFRNAAQYFTVVRVNRTIQDGIMVCSVECEHVSYCLNDENYNLVTFLHNGSVQAGLAKLLQNTPFSAGIVEISANVDLAYTEGTLNRRNALMNYIVDVGGEIEYAEYKINIRKHRGDVARNHLSESRNITNISVVLDGRENVSAYSIELYKYAGLSVGDEINITFNPLSINVNARIVGLSYNPYDTHFISVEVGGYVPNLLEASAKKNDANIRKIYQEFKAADGEMYSKLWDDTGGLSEIHQTIDSIDFKVETNKHNLMTGFASVDDQLAEMVDEQAQTASDLADFQEAAVQEFYTLTNTVSTLAMTDSQIQLSVSGLSNTISTITGQVTAITTDIASIELTMSQIQSTVTQNKQTADGQYTTLSSQITQKATEILSTVSANYATKTERENGDASTLSSANSAISQKATEILSTVSTTYATQTGLAAANAAITTGDSATLTAANSAISQKSTEILSTVSTTYATKTALATTNAAITNGDSATLTSANSAISQSATSILSTVSGTYATKTERSNGDATTLTSAQSSISQAINNITLSVSNGASSSTLSIKSGTTTLSSAAITFTGFVKFANLSTSGSTTINGGNITTGTINAALVKLDTSSIFTTANSRMVITNSNLNGVELSGAEVRLTGLNLNLYGAVYIPSGYSFQTNSPSYFQNTVYFNSSVSFANATVTGLSVTGKWG
jgi:hypothetical protein